MPGREAAEDTTSSDIAGRVPIQVQPPRQPPPKPKCPQCGIPCFDHLYRLHIYSCRQRYQTAPLWECPFNTLHVVPISEKSDHMKQCPDRREILDIKDLDGLLVLQRPSPDDAELISERMRNCRIARFEAVPSMHSRSYSSRR